MSSTQTKPVTVRRVEVESDQEDSNPPLPLASCWVSLRPRTPATLASLVQTLRPQTLHHSCSCTPLRIPAPVRQDKSANNSLFSQDTNVTERVEKEWEAIPASKCQELIASMPKRVAAVLKAKGGYVKY